MDTKNIFFVFSIKNKTEKSYSPIGWAINEKSPQMYFLL